MLLSKVPMMQRVTTTLQPCPSVLPLGAVFLNWPDMKPGAVLEARSLQYKTSLTPRLLL